VNTDLLNRVLAPRPPAFALLHRPESTGKGKLDVLVGTLSTPDDLAGIPLGHNTGPGHEVLAIVPYRQIAERGFAAVDDGEPLIALTVTDQAVLSVDDVLRRLPNVPTELAGGHFDVDDDAYAEIVRRVIADEIGEGEGANFVIKRSYVADITGYTTHSALSLFRRLMSGETGAYWTFLVHTGDRTFVGATPERHISLSAGTVVMNPISGTYRYPPSGPALSGVMDFLADRKESDELYMVLDEELKMMARICDNGGRVVGPYLREMARLAHTEYFIDGRSTRDPREILRETMFAPTVTGSPLESACKVISRYEPHGRGYYSGVIALIGRDEHGGRTMDSSIVIRRHRGERPGADRCRRDAGAPLRPGVRGRRDQGEGGRPARRAGFGRRGPLRRAPERAGGAGGAQREHRGLLADRGRRAHQVAAGAGRAPGADRGRRGHVHLDDRPPAAVVGPEGERAAVR